MAAYRRSSTYPSRRTNRSLRGQMPRRRKNNTTAYRALRYSRLALSKLNSELKYHDTLQTSAPNAGWQAFRLTAIPHGSEAFRRSGEKVRLKSLYIHGSITANTSASTQGQRIRICLVRSVPQTSAFTAADIYPPGIESLRNMSYTKKYHVLWHRIVTLDLDTHPRWQVEKYFKFNNLLDFLNDTTTNVEQNDLWLLYTTDAAGTPPIVNLHTRLRFIDN